MLGKRRRGFVPIAHDPLANDSEIDTSLCLGAEGLIQLLANYSRFQVSLFFITLLITESFLFLMVEIGNVTSEPSATTFIGE